jgi:hypothetical protein
MQKLLVLAGLLGIMFVASASAVDVNVLPLMPWETVQCEGPEADANRAAGLDPYTHIFPDPTPDDPNRIVAVHLLCTGPTIDTPLDTDCTSTGYTFTGWKWNAAENFQASGGGGISSSTAASVFSTSGNTWDNQDAFNMFGSVGTGSGSVPVANGVNQFNWANLQSNVIASTWTWSSGGVASESDASYNTDFAWSSSGAGGAMDLQNIATHELGHTFGMGHSSASSCLTMYPSGGLGETQKRTLGDGDIRGIQARY